MYLNKHNSITTVTNVTTDAVDNKKRLCANDQIVNVCSKSKRLRINDYEHDEYRENIKDHYSIEPKSESVRTLQPEPSVIQNPTQLEHTPIGTLKNVTLSISTDFTHKQHRVQNYGYDFKVLNYFDVEPNYNQETVQQQVQPILCPIINGQSMCANSSKRKNYNTNVLIDNPIDVYEDDSTLRGNDVTESAHGIVDNDIRGDCDLFNDDRINYTISNNAINTGALDIDDDDYDDDRTADKNKQFKFTKTKRNYISMYLNINNVPVLCNLCYGLNCICNK